MDYSFLRDRAFRAYRANQYPTLAVAHTDLIASLVAQYLYTKYTNSTGDLIPRYNSASDIKVEVKCETFELESTRLLHLSLESGSSIQTVVFLEENSKCGAFLKSTSPIFLAEVLESLEFESPLALQPILLTHDFITKTVNGLGDLVSEDSTVIGQIDMTFSPKTPLTGNSLKEFAVTFPKEDSGPILNRTGPPLDNLFKWLEKSTTLKFKNLNITSFACNLVTIRANTVTVLCPVYPEKLLPAVLRTLLDGMHT